MKHSSIAKPLKSSAILLNCFLFLAFLISGFENQFYAKEVDFAFKKTITFEIEENDTGYDLTSNVKVNYKYLSKISLKENVFHIYECFYSPIKNIKSFYNRRRLSRNTSFEYVNSEDVFIDNSKTHSVMFLENLKIGDEIEYSYDEEYKDIAFIPIIRIPNINFVEKFKIIIEHPEEVKADFEFFFPYAGLKYKITREDEKTVLEFDSLDEAPEIDFMPHNKMQAAIMIILKKGESPINPVQPEDFVKWYSKKVKFKSSISSKQKILTDSLLKGKNDLLSKLAAIDEYIKNNIRYVADEKDENSIIPREPALVLEQKYGDCKDRAFLAAAIAGEYGIKVNPVLINTEFAPQFKNVHPWLFNHVICEFSNNGKSDFFDPTAKYNEFGSLPKYEHNKRVLILDLDNPRLETVLKENTEPLIEIDITSHIDSLKNSKAIVTLRNEYGGYAKHAVEELTELQTENFISNLITSNLRNISLDYFTPVRTKTDSLPVKNNAVSFYAKADLSKYVISTSVNKYITKLPFIFIDNEILVRENDSLPIYLQDQLLSKFKLKISLNIPGYTSSNDSLQISDNATSTQFYAKSTSDSQSILNLEYNLISPSTYVDKNQREGFLGFCKNYLKNKNQMFLLNRK